jgi:hypothetical protein
VSYESTMRITRETAVSMLADVFAKKLAAAASNMSDSELEELLYENTRDTHYFDNFSIVLPEQLEYDVTRDL